MRSSNFSRRLTAGATIAAILVLAAAIRSDARPATKKVSIAFRPMVGSEPFACGKSYSNVGVSHATITPSDFGMYVYGVRLVAANGSEVPVALDQDGLYQNGDLALLDFEDGTGACSNGNASTHLAVTGTVPEGSYRGVRFTIGVPFERNHLELTASPSPLSITRMFWAWNSGHKFARFDAKTSTGKNWVLHLGSTGCTPTGSATIVPTACAQANRVDVSLTPFDPDHDAVVADAGALLAGIGATGDSSQVCMSSPKSAACAPIFARLGLPFNGSSAAPQQFLRIANDSAKAGAP
jgi:uncharacterized repeat protein (TIGR04052 family)